MKRSWLGFALTLALLIAAGCGTVGKNFDATRVKDIRNGATSKTDILNWFGMPFKEGVENGRVMWTYQLDEYYAIGSPLSKDLVLIFGSDDKVAGWRYTSTGGN